MGGCSSKPQTAECNEGLLDHPPTLNLLLHTSDSSPPQGPQHTLKSLFNQHGRDGKDLLENVQTLHDLLLHSKELPDFENQSIANTEADLQISFPCKQNSPVSVLSNVAENNVSKCTKMEGSLPEANEETGTEENAEKCTEAESFTSNSAEGNQEMGAANLEGFLSGLEEEKCGKLEVMLPALPEENVEDCMKAEGLEENQENAGKLEGCVSNLAEVKLEEECPKLTGMLSHFAEENASKLESESSPGIPESNSSQCAETRGPNLGPKSDFLKPNLLENLTTDDFQKINASDAMESKEAEVQGLNEIAMKGEINREVHDEIPMEAEKTPKQDEKAMKCEKNEKALHDEEIEEQIVKATEGEETEKTIEGNKTEMQCEKVLEIEKDEISQDSEKAEVLNEKAMEGELLKVQFEGGGISWVQGEKAMEDDTSQEKTEKAMECEKVDMQDEKVLEGRKTGAQDENSMAEDEKTGVQNERVFDSEAEKMQRDVEEERDVCVEKPESMQDAEKIESQDEKKTGVQDEKTRVQRKEAGEQDEEKAEDEKAMANVSPLHVNAEDEEAIADVPSSRAITLEKHTVVDSCFEPLTGSEQSIAIGCGPILELASKENTIELAQLGLIEKLIESDQKKLAFKDNTIIDVVADFGLTKKLEVDLKKLASDGNTIEAVGLEDIEKLEFEQKKTRKTEHIEKIESHESSIEAVAGGGHAKLCNTFKDEQSKSTDSEQMLHIERHGKLEHDILGAPQHSEADELDKEKNAKALVLEESSIEASIENSESSNQVAGEKRDDKSASELYANEEKKTPEALVEQSLHEGNAREEISNIECPSKLVVENDTSDVKFKVEVCSEESGFVQKNHAAEKLQCGHIQMPINELDLITSKGIESHHLQCGHIQMPINELDLITSKGIESQMQAHNESALCSTPESSLHENLPCPTVVEIDVEKRVVDINSSSLSAAEKSFIECVESKPKQKTSGEVIDDANGNTHMEASKQCERA